MALSGIAVVGEGPGITRLATSVLQSVVADVFWGSHQHFSCMLTVLCGDRECDVVHRCQHGDKLRQAWQLSNVCVLQSKKAGLAHEALHRVRKEVTC